MAIPRRFARTQKALNIKLETNLRSQTALYRSSSTRPSRLVSDLSVKALWVGALLWQRKLQSNKTSVEHCQF